MKKILLFIWILFVSLSFKATAHSPSSIVLDYNIETKELIVSITHSVSNPDTHYIYNISVEKNNEFYRSYDYNNQPSSSSFNYIYNVEAEAGDTFFVVASCNQGGQKSTSLTIGGGIEDKKTPGFEIILLIFAIVFILFLKTKKLK